MSKNKQTYVVVDPQMRGWFVRPMHDGTTYEVGSVRGEPVYAPAWEWGRIGDDDEEVVEGDSLSPQEAFGGPYWLIEMGYDRKA